MIRKLVGLSSLLLAFSPTFLLADTFNSVTVSGSLNVNGTSNLNDNVNLGNAAGDSITSVGYFKTNVDTRLGDGGSDTTTVYGTLNLLNASISGNINGSGANNVLPNQGNLDTGTGPMIVTRQTGDDRYARLTHLDSYLSITSAQGTYLSNSTAASNYLSISGNKTISGTVGFSGKLNVPGTMNVGSSNVISVLSAAQSHAVGSNLTVGGAYQFVIGRYNEQGDYSATDWESDEPLFVIGNGTLETPSNALTVFKNGDAIFNGNTTTNGIVAVPVQHIVVGTFDAPEGEAAFVVGNGEDDENRSNSFVIRKNGDAEVAGVLRVPESGDISQGEFR